MVTHVKQYRRFHETSSPRANSSAKVDSSSLSSAEVFLALERSRILLMTCYFLPCIRNVTLEKV